MLRTLDAWSAFAGAGACLYFGYVTKFAMQALDGAMAGVGISIPALHDDLQFSAIEVLPIAALFYLAIRGSIAALIQLTWQVRLWTVPRGRRWLIPIVDRGTGWMIALPLALVAPFVPFGLQRVAGSAAVFFLVAPAAVEFVSNRRGQRAAAPPETSLAQQQEGLCERLGAEFTPSGARTILVARGMWWGDPLVIARAASSSSSRWVVVDGRIRWDNKAWALDGAAFAQLRPDLAPLMGLPVGWVITTDPVTATFAPETATTVAEAIEACQLVTFYREDDQDLLPLVV
jgi:hypothetical protein